MRQPRRPFLALLAVCAIAALAPMVVAPPAAQACCVAPRVKQPPVDQAGERFLFIQDGDTTTAHVQVQYYGEAKDFSLIVPVEAAPEVSVGFDELFTNLRNATRPRFELEYKEEGKCKERPSSRIPAGAAKAAPSSAGMTAPAAGAVQVVSQTNVGPYESTVLKAEDAGSLRKWLTDNDYVVPAKLDGAMASYVAAKYYFVALKLLADREAGELRPVVLKYKAAKAGLPIKLTTLSAVPDMDVYVWVLGDQRAVPDNYQHVEINEARIDWQDEGNNYRQVVTEAINEAEDGRAFVTDYAGTSGVGAVTPTIRRRAELPVAELLARTNAYDFISYVLSQRYFEGENGKEWAFLGRHVPKPAAYKDVPDSEFYRGVSNSQEPWYSAVKDTTIDPGNAVDELNDTYVKPAKAVIDAFEAHPYLTQLYTTMSPEEMVQDPTFIANTTMEKVSNVRTAEYVTVCDQRYFYEDAPRMIRLKNGFQYYVTEGVEATEVKPGPMPKGGRFPAARAVMRCGTGRPTTVKDNKNAIAKLLNDLASQGVALRINTTFGANPRSGAGYSVVITVPFLEKLGSAINTASGWGCAGCSSPTRVASTEGANELGTYALFVAGALGYRLRLGRRRRK